MENQLTTSNHRDQLAIIPTKHVKEASKKPTATSVTSRVEEILKHHPALIIKLIGYARHQFSIYQHSNEKSHINLCLLADAIMDGIKKHSNTEVVKNLDIGIKLVEKLTHDHSYEVLNLMESMFLEKIDIHVSLLYNRLYKTMIQAFHPKSLELSAVGVNIQNQDALDRIVQLSEKPGVELKYADLEIILTCYNTVQTNWWKGTFTMTKPLSKHDNITALSCDAREDIAISREIVDKHNEVSACLNIVNHEFIKAHEAMIDTYKNDDIAYNQNQQQQEDLKDLQEAISEESGISACKKAEMLDIIDACNESNRKSSNFLEKSRSKVDNRLKEIHNTKIKVEKAITEKRPLALQDLQPNKKPLIADKGMFSDDKENTVFNSIDGLSA